jgi:hypothetical protein
MVCGRACASLARVSAGDLEEDVDDVDARGGGQPLRALFVGGVDKATTGVVERILRAHPACLVIPRLKFLSTRGGLGDLLAGETTAELFLERMRGAWYESSPALRELCPPDRYKVVLERFEREWNGRGRKPARRLVRSIVSSRVSGAPQMYWVEASPGNWRVAPLLFRVLPNTKVVLAVRDAPAAPVPPDPEGRSHAVRVNALLGPDSDEEYRALITFLGIADHGHARVALKAEIVRTGPVVVEDESGLGSEDDRSEPPKVDGSPV